MLTDLRHYEKTNPKLWHGRKDSLPDERFFQHIQSVDLLTFSLKNRTEYILVGFCSDEGIKRNEGRIGAKDGPDKLREQLGKLACHTDLQCLDVGNIVCQNGQLEEAQLEFATLLHDCHENGLRTLAFGGGHEIAWGHFKGLNTHYPKIGIINFDAHFDIRPLQQDQYGTSGTPFWQIKNHCDLNHHPFHYCCLGIQTCANTKSLFTRAKDWDIAYLTAEQIHHESFKNQTAFLDQFMRDHQHLYLSICLDVFADCYAPGVSAPQATGLSPSQVLPLLKYIVQTGKVVSIDIAELSPPLDLQDKTSRLAAIIIAELLNLPNLRTVF